MDYIVSVDPFEFGKTNRTATEMKNPGGKGINVSRVLNNLNIKTKALGFIGGFTGGFIEQKLREEKVDTDFIQVNGDTRINIKLQTGEETEINGQSPSVDQEHLNTLLEKLHVLQEGDLLVLAGSVPKSLPSNIYYSLLKEVEELGVKVIVDTSGEALEKSFPGNPFLIKPNHHELGELFDKSDLTVKDAVHYGRRILDKGVQNIIVSMAGEGALFLNKEITLFSNVPKGIVKNSVGAGDSVVAGFVASYSQHNDLVKAFQYGIAAGSATAFSNHFCEKAEIEKLIDEIEITKL